jgi:hypothetical protein
VKKLTNPELNTLYKTVADGILVLHRQSEKGTGGRARILILRSRDVPRSAHLGFVGDAPMTPAQEKHLRQRLDDGTEDERRLNEKLVEIGGEILVLAPADMNPNPEIQQQRIAWLLEHGQLIDAPILLKPKAMSNCQKNVATIWRRKQYGIAAICCRDRGLSDDGLWRNHTWGILLDGSILETTVKRERCFGLVQVGEMADLFTDMWLGEMVSEAPAVRKREETL